MKLAELKQLLWDADPAAVLVPPRVLERVIQQAWKLPTFLLQTPHASGFVVDRHVLFRHVEQEELELDPEHLLQQTVILLARPTAEELGKRERAEVLLDLWRRLFHANVHLVLENRWKEAAETSAEIRARIGEIGQDEFEEIRRVLVQDEHLPPHPDERIVYIEFAATYLELRQFANNLLATVFPGIRDFSKIDELIGRDVEWAALFARTRLAGAPEPVLKTDKSSDESYDYYWRLMRSAERESQDGNTVKSAILKTRAGRVAPAEQTKPTHEAALADIGALTARLQKALELSGEEAAGWRQHLPALLDKADQGSRPVEAALLFDLQKACLDHERDIYSLDLVEWLLSAGRRPIKRPLPSQRWVRMNKHLRLAHQKLTSARLSDADRLQLGQLIQSALSRHEERLRGRFRPILENALLDVGLQPANPTETIAYQKMVEELLDRIITNGFLTFSDLRDAISRNQLKLTDLGDPQEFIRGDPLLRLDRRLGALLDGVYRPSEIYMRWLERLTALNFGTASGRLLTWFVTIPVGGAFVLLEMAKLLFALFDRSRAEAVNWDEAPALNVVLLALVSFFLMGLMHVDRLRRGCFKVVRSLVGGGRALLVDMPLRLLPFAGLQRLLRTWIFQLVSWYLVAPLVICAVIWLLVPEPFETALGAGSIFVAVSFLLNSRLMQGVASIVLQSLFAFYEEVRAGLLPTLFHLVVRFFRRVLDTVEYVLYTVDEWLRFRSGDSRFSLVLRTGLGVLWYPISYVARFYMVVLIEPMINPIKLPVSSLAYKFMLPFQYGLIEWISQPLRHVFGEVLGLAIAVGNVWLVPDAVGFLFWEIKENWFLYRANRRGTLKPVAIGPHGETVRGLLHPGFHSGTVPKLYAYLREAERLAQVTGNWRDARKHRHALQEVEKSLKMFVGYELVSLLHQTPAWSDQPLAVGHIVLSTNRIQVELNHRDRAQGPFVFELVERGGWLIGGIRQVGWVEGLPAPQVCALNTAVAGLYALAGVDLVQEQIRAHLPAAARSYDLNADGLVLWLDARSVSYDLHTPEDCLDPRVVSGGEPTDGPAIDARELVFARNPLPWSQWIASWAPAAGSAAPRLAIAGNELNVLGVPLEVSEEATGAPPLSREPAASAEAAASATSSTPSPEAAAPAIPAAPSSSEAPARVEAALGAGSPVNGAEQASNGEAPLSPAVEQNGETGNGTVAASEPAPEQAKTENP